MNKLQWNQSNARQPALSERVWQGVFCILVVVILGYIFIDGNLTNVFQNTPAASATTKGGVQEVSMAVTGYGYEPSSLTIKAGVPVRWKIDGTGASGCTSVITIPSLNIVQPLKSGENIVEFTAPQKGQVAFMCSMGMVRGSFTVL